MRVKKQILSLSISLFATVAGAMPTATVTSLNPVMSMTSTSVATSIIQNIKGVDLNVEVEVEDNRAEYIDNYFAKHNLPLTGYGKVFVKVADKYDLDYRLLPAIAMRESTGGKFACYNDKDNVFGWHSCKTTFDSQEAAIDKVGAHLAGEIKSTKGYYGNKTVWKKLRTYNSVIAPYPDQVIAIMNKIEVAPIDEQAPKLATTVAGEIALK